MKLTQYKVNITNKNTGEVGARTAVTFIRHRHDMERLERRALSLVEQELHKKYTVLTIS